MPEAPPAREEVANRVAWSGLKQVYATNDDGRCVRKDA